MTKTSKAAAKVADDGAGNKTVAVNRRASFDYQLGERYEAGLVLVGTEVKSLREGRASLAEAWVKVGDDGEAWLMQAHIPEYSHAGEHAQHVPTRNRKLLLHRREIDQLARAVKAKGSTLVPTRVYFREGNAKLEFAVATGKHAHDKRQAMAERDAARQVARALASRRRGD